MKKIQALFIGTAIYFSGQALATEPNHLEEAMKVYDVSMRGFSYDQAAQYAQLFYQDENFDLEETTNTIYDVMRSQEFKIAYSQIIADIFSKEECTRLAEILEDPVLEKYRIEKPEYSQRIVALAQEMLLSKLERK